MNVSSKTRVKPPTQARSRASFDRMLDAAERRLATQDFESLTIAEIVSDARTSVGVFYARFEDKEALLDALYDRHQREIESSLDEWEAPRWTEKPLDEFIRARVARLIRLYRDNRGLYRTLVMRGHQKPDARYAQSKTRQHLFVASFGAIIANRKDEVDHPNPKKAASLAYLMVLATLRELLLFSESTASAVELSDAELEDELVTMVCAYLRVGGRLEAIS
jgi:AcrR family transcriptional regulator